MNSSQTSSEYSDSLGTLGLTLEVMQVCAGWMSPSRWKLQPPRPASAHNSDRLFCIQRALLQRPAEESEVITRGIGCRVCGTLHIVRMPQDVCVCVLDRCSAGLFGNSQPGSICYFQFHSSRQTYCDFYLCFLVLVQPCYTHRHYEL